jgi:alkanesulfonate monooxygenase SsuD/methylene tetrahydromethanopterin reductase-like flavin-dependent oxidoreductase (luciferase family)
MTFDIIQFGFGITGKVPTDVVRELAPMVEQAGFNSMWFNHITNGNAYDSIRAAASVTSSIVLGSGVTSIDSMMSAREIADQVRGLNLPTDRLIIGIGANKPPSPLSTVREGIELLHQDLPDVPVYVGALGPKMRELGVEQAEGVLLNWLTPDAASLAMDDRRRHAPDTNANVALYIRCALGEENRQAIEAEAARYEGFPSYAANFERLGFRAMDAAVFVTDSEELKTRLAAFQGVIDQPILRAITSEDTLEAYASLVESVRN